MRYLQPCALPGCPNLVEKGYCKVHQHFQIKPDNRKGFEKLDQNKDPATIKFYNSPAWIKVRRAYKKRHPLCEECLIKGISKPAQLVHHKKRLIDIWRDKENPLSFKNLQSLCKICHLKELRSYKKIHKKG